MASTSAMAQDAAAVANPKENSQSAELLATAGKLVKYGYETKSAMPLIQAVEIYNRLGVTDAEQTPSKAEESDAVVAAEPQPKADAVAFDQKQLLADATRFADGDRNLLALIKSVGDTRGRTTGATRHVDRVNAGSTDVYNMSFRGGENATVIVSGDGDTDLDLYVYDNNGNLIAYDNDGTDDCVVSFTPRWTGNFKIKIKNLGRVYNQYVLLTN